MKFNIQHVEEFAFEQSAMYDLKKAASLLSLSPEQMEVPGESYNLLAIYEEDEKTEIEEGTLDFDLAMISLETEIAKAQISQVIFDHQYKAVFEHPLYYRVYSEFFTEKAA